MPSAAGVLDRAANWLVRSLIGWRARAGSARAARAYQAGRHRVGQKYWHAPDTGPQAEIEPALALMRARARQMVRDNPYAARAVAVLVAHQVGAGIAARIASPRIQALWDAWARRCDHAGLHDLGGLMALAARARSEGGEALIRLRVVSQAEARRRGLPPQVPLTLEVLEGDMLPLHTTLLPPGGNRIVQGVEFAPDGSRVAYHLRRQHPGETGAWAPSAHELERVPADQVIHLFRVLRPGQVRGVPDLAPVLLRLKMLDDYEDAALAGAKIQSLLSVFFTSNDPIEVAPDRGASAATPATLDLYPGSAHNLPVGVEPKFLQPTGAGPFEPYALHQLMAAAVGFGVTYDQLTGDLRQANYSSLRAGKIEFRRMIEQDQWLMLVPRMCEPIWRAFADLAAVGGAFDAPPDVQWQPPRFEMIDPAKEIEAALVAVRAGFETWDQAVASFGYDPEHQAEEIAHVNARFDALGLILDADPRRMTRSGVANDQAQNAAIEIAATGAALPRSKPREQQ